LDVRAGATSYHAVGRFTVGHETDGTAPESYLAFETRESGAGSITEKVRITSAGNVGIGTTAPTDTLNIFNTSEAAIGVESTGGDAIVDVESSGGDAALFAYSSAGNVAFVADSDGGTSIFEAFSEVDESYFVAESVASDAGFVAITANTANPYLQFDNDDNLWSLYEQTDDSLRIYSQAPDADVFTITSAGLVGIGTTAPEDSLSVGNINIGDNYGSGYEGIWLNGETAGTAYNFLSSAGDKSLYINRPSSNSIEFRENNSPQMIIEAGGNVGIGTTSPGLALDVVGSGRFSAVGSGTYDAPLNITSDGTLTTATSDLRMKRDIAEIDNPLQKVLSLNGVYFRWKENPLNPPSENGETEGRTMIGMIAQDVMEIVPELVYQNPTDGYYGINYGETSALLVEAIKEQHERITNYELGITNELLMINDQSLTTDEKFTIIGATLEELQERITNHESRIMNQEEQTEQLDSRLRGNDSQLEQLSLTIDSLNQLSSLMIDQLSDHEMRLQNLENEVITAGASTEFELSEELQEFDNVLQILGEEEGSMFEVDGDLKVKEFDAEKVKTKEIEVEQEGIIMKTPTGNCFRVTLDEEGKLQSQSELCEEELGEELSDQY